MEREDVAQLRQRPLECSSDSTPAVVGPSPAGVCAEGAQCERTGFSAPCELQGMAGPGTFATGTTLPPSAVGTGATGQRKVDAHAEIRDCCAAGIACQVVVLVLGICSVISNFWLNFDRADQVGVTWALGNREMHNAEPATPPLALPSPAVPRPGGKRGGQGPERRPVGVSAAASNHHRSLP